MSITGDFRLYYTSAPHHVAYSNYTTAISIDYLLECKESEELNGAHTLEVSVLCVDYAQDCKDIAVGYHLIAHTSQTARAYIYSNSYGAGDDLKNNFEWSEFVVTHVERVQEAGVLTLHITAEDISVDLNNYLIDELRYKHDTSANGYASIFSASGMSTYITPHIYKVYSGEEQSFIGGSTYLYRCSVKDAIAQLDEKRNTRSVIGIRSNYINRDLQLSFIRSLILFDVDEQTPTNKESPIIVRDNMIKNVQHIQSGFIYDYVIGLGKGEQVGEGYTKRIKSEPVFRFPLQGSGAENLKGKYLVFEDIEDKAELQKITEAHARAYFKADTNYKVELVSYELAFNRIGTYYKIDNDVYRMYKVVRDWLEPHNSVLELGVPESSIINDAKAYSSTSSHAPNHDGATLSTQEITHIVDDHLKIVGIANEQGLMTSAVSKAMSTGLYKSQPITCVDSIGRGSNVLRYAHTGDKTFALTDSTGTCFIERLSAEVSDYGIAGVHIDGYSPQANERRLLNLVDYIEQVIKLNALKKPTTFDISKPRDQEATKKKRNA